MRAYINKNTAISRFIHAFVMEQTILLKTLSTVLSELSEEYGSSSGGGGDADENVEIIQSIRNIKNIINSALYAADEDKQEYYNYDLRVINLRVTRESGDTWMKAALRIFIDFVKTRLNVVISETDISKISHVRNKSKMSIINVRFFDIHKRLEIYNCRSMLRSHDTTDIRLHEHLTRPRLKFLKKIKKLRYSFTKLGEVYVYGANEMKTKIPLVMPDIFFPKEKFLDD